MNPLAKIAKPDPQAAYVVLAIIFAGFGAVLYRKAGCAIVVCFFAVATILLLLATRAVTIDLDRAADKFSIRYGGIVVGIPKKTIERPLHDLKFASTDVTSGTGLTYSNRGRSSRVVFVFATEEKIPLTRFWSSGDRGDHHAIEHAVNDFLEYHK